MKGSKGNGLSSRFGFSFKPSSEKGAGVKKNSGASTLPSKQLSSSGLQQPSKLTAKPTNNKIDRQPSNASSKQEANRYGHKTSSTNLNQVNGNLNGNNNLQQPGTNSNSQPPTSPNGIENKQPTNKSSNNSLPSAEKGVKSLKSPSKADVGASNTATRLRSPFRLPRRRGVSPSATSSHNVDVSVQSKRGLSPVPGGRKASPTPRLVSPTPRQASSSPAANRKLVSPMAGRRVGMSRGGLVPKPYRPASSTGSGTNKPLLSVSGNGVKTETSSNTNSTTSSITLSRSLSSASSRPGVTTNNVPIRTNPRASASSLPDTGNKFSNSLPSSYQPFIQAISAANSTIHQNSSTNQIPSTTQYSSTTQNCSTTQYSEPDLAKSSSHTGGTKLPQQSGNVRSFATLRGHSKQDFPRFEGIGTSRVGTSNLALAAGGKPDLQGMRASFFSNNNNSTSRLVKLSHSSDTSLYKVQQKTCMATVASTGISMHQPVSLASTTTTSLASSSAVAGTIIPSTTKENNEHYETKSKLEVVEPITKKDGPSIDTLAMIAGIGSHDSSTNRVRSFRRLPPPSSSRFQHQESTIPGKADHHQFITADTQNEAADSQLRSADSMPGTAEDQSRSAATKSNSVDNELLEAISGISSSAFNTSGGGQVTKRKWTRNVVQNRPIPCGAVDTQNIKEDVIVEKEVKSSALDCLEQLKSSTRSVLDQHRSGIRTNPKVSLRRQVLPSIPQEGSEHPTPELLNHGHHQLQLQHHQQQQQLQQRLSATNEHIKRLSGSADIMKSSTESSGTTLSNQSTSSADDIKTVISNNNMMSSTDEIDLDDELIIIQTEDYGVPEVKLQSSNAGSATTAAMKLMNSSFHESSPNETESDSGVFTSSYSKYSLDSLQDDKDQDSRSKPAIQKSIVRLSDTQAAAQVPVTSASSSNVPLPGTSSQHKNEKLPSYKEEQIDNLEPELRAFQEVASSLAVKEGNRNSTEICSLTASMEASLTSSIEAGSMSSSCTSNSAKFMVASTSNFSDMDEVGSSRETSPMQLLDDLLKKNEERNDERRAISSGTVKQNCKKFENKCHKQSQQQQNNADKKSAECENKKSTESENLNYFETGDKERNKINSAIINTDDTMDCNDSSDNALNVESNAPKENAGFQEAGAGGIGSGGGCQTINAEMVKSITSSTSMSSSITETTQSVSEAVPTTDKSTSGHTKSPSSFSDNDKDFLIDDDYKDQPQLTFYDQEDSIEESIFSTLDSLLAGKDDSNAIEYKSKECGSGFNGEKMVHAGSGAQAGQGLHGAVTIPGKTGLKASDSPASSPRRCAPHHQQNLRKFSITNHLRDQVGNDDSESQRLRSRADTLSSLASDDCMMDFECRITDEEDLDDEKADDQKRSMSPRMREVDHHHHNNLDATTTTTTSNNRLDNNNTDSNSKHNNSCSSTQPDSQCTAVLYGAEFNKPGLSRSSSLTSDEGVIIDRSTHNTLTQDTLEIKFLLLKLRRVLQEVEGVDGGLPTKLLESVLSPDNESSMHEENMDLKRQVTLLQQQVEERDRRLRHLEMEAMTRSSHTPTRSNNNITKNAAIQTERVRPVSCGSIGQDGLIRQENF